MQLFQALFHLVSVVLALAGNEKEGKNEIVEKTERSGRGASQEGEKRKNHRVKSFNRQLSQPTWES